MGVHLDGFTVVKVSPRLSDLAAVHSTVSKDRSQLIPLKNSPQWPR